MRAACLAALLITGPAFAEPVPEPSDYREDEYRAPVPDTLAGATVVDAVEAHDLWQSGNVVFVDVLPRPPKPKNLPEGTIWRERPRLSIPGSIWLPNVGYGRIAEVTDQWFRDGLTNATGEDTSRPVLFFCLANCWMSWNAAKRALEYGYTDVYWLPGGTDTWEFEEFPLAEITAQPEP
ncbi:PQQ-dependent catabolism-associated CXXCW motif protein [Algicella marina]|uniref:PQQ-dependent catabolism-associated CXXCW motif protein n=1 Tax=Algicella marina TaxID=2683284 RepID=A0A6P1T6Y1_9RHOB|nr:PQQ-dependent catabolism-associated CXXCW motif protein [Algicella marina]QHQ37453.1 PQQ-dependent catabolism-associated CXXCW motif protein [Algicella marina]